jgi:1-acyl-sn-glycerol-3-phosphate acyltransferase
VVVEGRDAGSYVFPQARWRFYLDASLAERARRRLRQELGEIEPAPDQLTDAMERLATRDRIDRGRPVAPLKVPDGAIVLDTTQLSLDQVVGAIAHGEAVSGREEVRRGRARRWISSALHFTFKQPLRFFFTLFYGLKVEGADYCPRTGGCVVVSNHQSYFDPPLLGVALPRMLIYTPRTSLGKSRIYRLLTWGLDLEPVARDGRDVGAARRMIERVRAGEVLVLFPEQTRTRDGCLGSITPGFHMIAARAPAPVLPVVIDGAFDAWPRARRLPRVFGRIRIRVGPPFEVKDLERDEAARRVQAALVALGAKAKPADARRRAAGGA